MESKNSVRAGVALSTIRAAPAEVALARSHLGKDAPSAVDALINEPLSSGWEPCRDDDGEIYYHCAATGASRWGHPGKAWADLHRHDVEAAALSSANNFEELDGHSRRRRRGRSQLLEEQKRELLALRARLARLGRNDSCKEDGNDGGSEDEATEGSLGEALPAEQEALTRLPIQHSVYDARSRDTPLPTPPTLFAEAGLLREDLLGRVFVLHGLLTPAEAGVYVSGAAGSGGFNESDVAREFPAEVRNNTRLVHFSKPLAQSLWHRLAPQLKHRDVYLARPMGFCSEGRWKPVGVNPCFRIARYLPGEKFAPHCDGMYVNDEGDCSIYSIVLYLNDDFDGGGLKFQNSIVFKPRSGSAAFFPHDKQHEAEEVTTGVKYAVRSELMFRCVSSAPPPREPQLVTDPRFRRMCSLYEQVGSLVQAGNSSATTAAYQEALGIQIEHAGTLAVAAEKVPLNVDQIVLISALRLLSIGDALRTASASRAWLEVASLGVIWRELYRRDWPQSRDAEEDAQRGLDAELKDWRGLYRRQCFLNSGKHQCTVFLDDKINALASCGAQLLSHGQLVDAKACHLEVGIGWDRSLNERVGWSIGTTRADESWLCEPDSEELKRAEDARSRFSSGYVPPHARRLICKEQGVQWNVLAELFKYTFDMLQVDPSEAIVLVPTLPGVHTSAVRSRLVQLLAGRFQVPTVYLPPAPLCVLLAHRRVTGTVVWRCAVGKHMVCCYHDGEEVAASTSFQVANERVPPELAEAVLSDVYFWSSAGESEDRPAIPPGATLHDCARDDVLRGAQALAASPELLERFKELPEERAVFEWRRLVGGQWEPLPQYAAGILEGALAAKMPQAEVSVGGCRLVADLKHLIACEGGSGRVRDSQMNCYLLTRFLRGRPSAKPDLRSRKDLEKPVVAPEVEEVAEGGLTVRTLAGRAVFSCHKTKLRLSVTRELLEELCHVLKKDMDQLKLLRESQPLELQDDLLALLPETGNLELAIVVAAKEEKDGSRVNTFSFRRGGGSIPEDHRGEAWIFEDE